MFSNRGLRSYKNFNNLIPKVHKPHFQVLLIPLNPILATFGAEKKWSNWQIWRSLKHIFGLIALTGRHLVFSWWTKKFQKNIFLIKRHWETGSVIILNFGGDFPKLLSPLLLTDSLTHGHRAPFYKIISKRWPNNRPDRVWRSAILDLAPPAGGNRIG